MSLSSLVIESRPLLEMNPDDAISQKNLGQNGIFEPVDEDTLNHHRKAIWESRAAYGAPGFRGLLASPYVAACAAFSALGGLLFGYE